ncbi:MAG: SUMF1/EgtB/PvdO family nonheme iron enzyme [Oceanicoccus sp.]
MTSEFESQLSKAKSQHRKKILLIPLGLIVFIPILLLLLIDLSFVPISITPERASNSATVVTDGGGHFTIGSTLIIWRQQGELRISAYGYEDIIILLSEPLADRSLDILMHEKHVYLTATPSEPVEAPIWWVNGLEVSVAPVLQYAVKPGTYSITMESLFHDSVQQVVEVPFSSDVDAVLSVTRSLAEYSIETLPIGADVFINNELVGQTPLVGNILQGEHSFSVNLKDYSAISEVVRLSNIEPKFERNYTLLSGHQSVGIRLLPKGGALYVNGKPVTTDSSISIPVTSQSSVLYEKEGYESKRVSVSPAQKNLSITLQPLYGRATISSQEGVMVSIDGKRIGIVPVSTDLLATSHQVILSKPGYVQKSLSVNISEGESYLYDERLLTEKEYALTHSKSSYINSVGMAMLRMKPAAFTMGSPRSQKARRANEVERSVQFSREIYVGTKEVSIQQYKMAKNVASKDPKPITMIDWNAAALYCNWLSKNEGFPAVYTVESGRVVGADMSRIGYRLLTEAEWEWAAKQANRNRMSVFVWGDDYKLNDRSGNLSDKSADGFSKVFIPSYNDGFSQLAPIGSFKREASGLYDQSGNVKEWVHDYYLLDIPQRGATYTDYYNARRAATHVIKGSSYSSGNWQKLRVAYKDSGDKGKQDLGFRVARYLY